MVQPMAYNKRKKKACKTVLYCKIKERRKTGGEWLIGAHTQKDNLPFNCNNTTQRRVRRLLMRVKARRRVGALARINGG